MRRLVVSAVPSHRMRARCTQMCGLIECGCTISLHMGSPPHCVRVYRFVACRCTVAFHTSVPFCRVRMACVSGSSALGDVGIALYPAPNSKCAAPIPRGPRPLLCHLTNSVATGPALVLREMGKVGTCYSPLVPRSIIPGASHPRPLWACWILNGRAVGHACIGEALGLGRVMVSVGILSFTEPCCICVAKGRNEKGITAVGG
ncbi:hypothetical protein BD779DRAFT_1560669 [Infundibulicybe gibba]|nr:hypothetical protein BD779DRAFT_1560669 [Infundibulicybe gibba]